jgi:hypothetical protein
VHKDAYRPTKEEAAAAFEEARVILFWLKNQLDISDDLAWYQVTSSATRLPAR